jgi:hypothetical protein
VITTLGQVTLNDRVILPPFASEVNYEFHTSQRCTSRRVLAMVHDGETVTIHLDGHEPRTLPASLNVIVF